MTRACEIPERDPRRKHGVEFTRDELMALASELQAAGLHYPVQHGVPEPVLASAAEQVIGAANSLKWAEEALND